MPDKRSFPPRTLTILILTIVEGLAISVFIILRFHWRAIDPADPRRRIADETSNAFQRGLRKIFGYIRRPA